MVLDRPSALSPSASAYWSRILSVSRSANGYEPFSTLLTERRSPFVRSCFDCATVFSNSETSSWRTFTAEPVWVHYVWREEVHSPSASCVLLSSRSFSSPSICALTDMTSMRMKNEIWSKHDTFGTFWWCWLKLSPGFFPFLYEMSKTLCWEKHATHLCQYSQNRLWCQIPLHKRTHELC